MTVVVVRRSGGQGGQADVQLHPARAGCRMANSRLWAKSNKGMSICRGDRGPFLVAAWLFNLGLTMEVSRVGCTKERSVRHVS